MAKIISVKGWFTMFSFFLFVTLIHPAYAALNSVSIDTGTPGSLTNVTISPDNDGTDDRAYVHFSSDVSGSFKVIVDTNGTAGFQTPDWADPNSWQTSDTTMEGWAGAGGSNQFMFEGRDNTWRVLANGVYSIRIIVDEDGDWINTTLDESVDDTLTATVQTASLSGTVTSNGNPLSGVQVNAGSQYGWGNAETDAGGNYTISGLGAGSYNVNAQKNGYVSANYSGGNVTVTAGQNTSGINMTMSPSIQITGSISIPSAFTSSMNMWGGMEDQLWININGWTDDGSGWAWGNAHIHATDGWICMNNPQPGDDMDFDGNADVDECSNATSTTFALDVNPPASGQTKTYHIRAEANGYASAEYTVTVDANGGAQNITMTKASSIFGTVVLPSANAGSTPIWVNVNAKTSSGTMAWGGGSVEVGQTQGTFQINSALEGTYTVEVQVMGYKTSTVSGVVVTAGQDADLGSINISQGGTISGTITISGDTTSYQMYMGDDGSQPIWLWIDAWSPDSNGWSGTQVQIPRGVNQSVSYTVGGLGAGTYEIHSWMGEGYEQTPIPLTATLVGDTSNVTGVDMSFAPYSGQVTGTVSGTGLDMSKVVVRAMKAGWGWQSPVTAQPSGDGSYTLTDLGTSEYILEVNEYSNSADMMNGAPPQPTGNFGTEIIRVPVTNGETTSGQNVTLSTGGVITGTVSLEPGYSGTVNFNTDLVGKMVTAIPMKTAMMGGSTMFMGPIMPDGTYAISGLGSGAYSVSPPTELTVQIFDPSAQMMQAAFEPDIAADGQMVTVSAGQTKSGVDFVLSDGYSVSGTLTLPEVQTGNDWDYVCELELRHPRKAGMGRHMPVFVKDFNGTKTYSFTLEHVMDGDYVIQAWTNNYTVAYQNISVNGSDVAGANLELKKGANITGTLINAGNGQAVTPSDGIMVRCEAYPWVEGSWRETRQDPWSTSRFEDQGGVYTGAFTLANLPAGTYVVTVQAENGMKQNGAKNYIGIRKAGVVVPETSGASVDIGTMELREGVSISGTVTSASTGALLGNIDVEARPVDSKDGATSAFATTDSKGIYTIYGVDPNVKYYTVVAGSRPDFMQFIPVTWGEVKKNVEVTSSGLTGLDFALPAANATLSGTIHKTGSSPWTLPFMDDADMPAPFVLLQKQGEVYSDPMAGIETIGEPSDSDTSAFSVSGIVPGTYNLKIFSRGYTTKIVKGIVIAEGSNVISTPLEMVEGGTVSGTVVMDDGTYPTTSEVSEVVAVSADLEVLIFGTLTSNEASREVSAYSVSGLEAGKSYMLVFVNDGDKGAGDIHVMPDPVQAGDTYNAVIGDNAPIITARAIKNDDGTFSIGIFSTSILNDASASNILSLSQGGGSLSSTLSADKTQISATYTPDAGDTIFILSFTAHYGTNNTEVSTSLSYDVNATAWNQGTVNTLLGGSVSMGQGDKSQVFLEAGDISDASGSGVSTVTMQKDDSTVSGNSVYASSVSARSILSETTDPLPSNATAESALYDISLPAGDSITTGAAVTVSLQYNDSVTDTTDLHIYHFTGGEWVAEDTNRTIDDVNKTITADVTSLSPFQVVTASSVDTPADTPADTPVSTPVTSGGGSSGGGGCSLASNPISLSNGMGEMALMLLPVFVIAMMKLRRRSQDRN